MGVEIVAARNELGIKAGTGNGNLKILTNIQQINSSISTVPKVGTAMEESFALRLWTNVVEVEQRAKLLRRLTKLKI